MPTISTHGAALMADLDRFSVLLILTALKALRHDPGLWERTGNLADSLLFHRRDLGDPSGSPVFAELAASGDGEVRRLAEAMKDSLLTGRLPSPISHLLGSWPTVIKSTTDTIGWWKGSRSTTGVAEQGGDPLPHPSIGSGWIRAFVGSNAAASAEHSDGSDANSLLHQVPFVASFNRTYVHRSTCEGAQQVSKRNHIGFATLDEAYASCYRPC